jgi:hypothetical protein
MCKQWVDTKSKTEKTTEALEGEWGKNTVQAPPYMPLKNKTDLCIRCGDFCPMKVLCVLG